MDASSRTNIPNIYAVSDVPIQLNLATVAIREGHAFAVQRRRALQACCHSACNVGSDAFLVQLRLFCAD
ncbi:hypothetical protein [Bradyrhizobium vignae]|uniref:hypothetical protein n=1 Tax=Bradyrhizobium vignae TaxID=1549949 RepID=UPI003221E8F0